MTAYIALHLIAAVSSKAVVSAREKGGAETNQVKNYCHERQITCLIKYGHQRNLSADGLYGISHALQSRPTSQVGIPFQITLYNAYMV